VSEEAMPSEAVSEDGQQQLEASVREQIASTPSSTAPDFYIVGHPKCGTTALYEMLREHPMVFMPDRKEPGFFSTDLRYSAAPRASGAGPETYGEYLSLFAAASDGQLVGEASTSYVWSQAAPSLIAAARPDARVIDIVREPAALLRSLHLQLLENRSEEVTSLRRALELQEERRAGRSLTRLAARRPQALMYTDRVQYIEQLERFHEHFSREQILVLVYDDFRRDNEGTMRAVQRFLGIDDTLPFRTKEANPTTRRRVSVDETVRKVTTGESLAARLARTGAHAVPRRVRRKALSFVEGRVVFAKPRAPDEALMLELRRRFEPEVRALSEYLGRDLVALWGYDAL
jgi:Sulfotransferase family